MATLYLTGFGPFGDVTTNPTMEIIEALKEEGKCTGEQCSAEFLNVVEVSAIGVDRYLADVQNAEGRRICIHLGVFQKSTQFRVEKTAYNNMNFRIKDAQGFQPSNTCINGECQLDNPKDTQFNVAKAVSSLQEDGFDVVESDDPGRYICNYIYYKSLEAEEQRLDSKAGATGAIGAATGTDTTGNWSDCKVRSIFIHLPLFTTIAKDVQIAFVKRAVAILCADDSCA